VLFRSESNHVTGTFDVVVDDTAAHWTVRESPTDIGLASVAWSGTRFVAVGQAGTILVSPDAIDWTFVPSGSASNLLRVIWAGSQFVAVGEQGTILTSPDGMTWTSRDSTLPSSTWRSVAWSGAQFVAVGAAPVPLDPASAIVTSPDAVTWTPRDFLVGAMPYAVAWSGREFVVVGGTSGVYVEAAIFTSPGGSGWTQQTVQPNDGYFYDIASNGMRMVAIGSQNSLFTSLDAVSWMQFAVGTIGGGVVAAGPYHFLICNTAFCSLSPDGMTWNQMPALPGQPGSMVLSGLTWGGTKWVGVGPNGVIATSP